MRSAVEFKAVRQKTGVSPTKWAYNVFVYDADGKKHEVGQMQLWYPIKKDVMKIIKEVLEV